MSSHRGFPHPPNAGDVVAHLQNDILYFPDGVLGAFVDKLNSRLHPARRRFRSAISESAATGAHRVGGDYACPFSFPM